MGHDPKGKAAVACILRGKLRDAIKKQPKQDIRLIRFLSFEGIAVKETEGIFGCSRKSIGNRRRRILEKLRREMVFLP